MTRLTILLGAGGVGKTTLAAGLALAHARAGARTALLGVDPARRLRSALGLTDLGEASSVVAPGLTAAVLDPSASLRRWLAEACLDPAARTRLLLNPYFVAFADRIATLADAVGCARAAEWTERDPALDELVLDTAPGVAAVELLSRPARLLAFFDGRMVRWLVRLSRFGAPSRALSSIGDLTGASALRDIGELLGSLDDAIATLSRRLSRAREWLADTDTAIVLVCGVRDDAAATTGALVHALRELSLAPSLVVLNRVLPDVRWEPAPHAPEARAFVRFIANHRATQERVLRALPAPVLGIPDALGLDAPDRRDALATLGELVRARLTT